MLSRAFTYRSNNENKRRLPCACRCFQSVLSTRRRTLACTNASKGAAFGAEEHCFVIPGNICSVMSQLMWDNAGCLRAALRAKVKNKFENLMGTKTSPLLKTLLNAYLLLRFWFLLRFTSSWTGISRGVRGNASCWAARLGVRLLLHASGSGSAAVRRSQSTPGEVKSERRRN